MEKIGNVSLDDTHYPGEDLYSDGDVEDRILKLVQEHPQKEFPRLIAKEQDWAVMYHLAHERENIISWYPFAKEAKILEVGSGCGAVTGAVLTQARSVTCIDLSKKRSMVNAVRHQEFGNLKICLGNFQEVEKGLDTDFDYATLIGVFEYGQGYIGGEKPYHDFLDAVMKHLRPGGKLLLAIENKFGLKYWAGCREDHAGTYFEGLEGYPNHGSARTFSRPELMRLLKECGYCEYKFYYPYPDYKFPTVIYSDDCLPKTGELNQNICNFDRDRLVLMDEGRVYGELIKDGMFPFYANSFFLEITKPCRQKTQENAKSFEQILYTKYSSGRGAEFSIQTRIVRDIDGKNILYKKAEYPQGEAHIGHMEESCSRLTKMWREKDRIKVNQCRRIADRIEFEYLDGITLEEVLDSLLAQGKDAQAAQKIRDVLQMIKESAGTEEFQMTPEFEEVFGAVKAAPGELSFSVSDVDLIFSNLLITKEGRYHALDYEWTFFFPVPLNFLLYRALHYYLNGASRRRRLGEQFDFYGECGITPQRRAVYEQMEQSFQAYIAKESVTLGSLYHSMGKNALPLGSLLAEADRRRVQVYLDYGEGFSEENSYFIGTGLEEKQEITIAVPQRATGVWVDPALSPCLLKDVVLNWEQGSENVKIPAKYSTTGYEMEKGCYLFDNSDPKIIIEEMPQEGRRLEISYRISILEEETAVLLMERLNAKGRVKKRIRGLIKG